MCHTVCDAMQMDAPMAVNVAEAGLMQELRRGTLVLAVLSALERAELCGADLRAVLMDAGLPIEEGALYPMLRRLEDQGLLTSERRPEDSRMKRFYRPSRGGRAARRAMLTQWDALSTSLTRLNGEPHGSD